MVNVSYNLMGTSLSILFHKILINPHYNMILEHAFDHLMKQIRRQELVDVSPRKSVSEWLQIFDLEHRTETNENNLQRRQHEFRNRSIMFQDPKH
jgi:hypothetical protein